MKKQLKYIFLFLQTLWIWKK